MVVSDLQIPSETLSDMHPVNYANEAHQNLIAFGPSICTEKAKAYEKEGYSMEDAVAVDFELNQPLLYRNWFFREVDETDTFTY